MRRSLRLQAQVPLASHHRVVASVAQHLGKGHDTLVEVTFVPRHSCSGMSTSISREMRRAYRATPTSLRLRIVGLPALGQGLTLEPGPARVVCELDEVAQARDVVVRPRHDHGARGAASRGRVEARVAHTLGAQPIDVRRLDLAAEAADVAEAHVIRHDDEEVGAFAGRFGHFDTVSGSSNVRIGRGAVTPGRTRSCRLGTGCRRRSVAGWASAGSYM